MSECLLRLSLHAMVAAVSSNPATPENEKPLEPGEVPVIHGQERPDARTRGSYKRERVNNENALAQVVTELLPLSEEKWIKLGVPELTIDKLLDARKIKAYAARARHLRLIRATLRDTDWALIRRRLDHIKAGFALGMPEGSPQAIQWTEQLLVQGDPGLARFMEHCPNADRKRIRQLVRNVTSAPDNKRGKVRIQLERAVELEVSRAHAAHDAAVSSASISEAEVSDDEDFDDEDSDT